VTRICLIAARARNGVIGQRGALPWRLPEDLAHFKRLTMGQTVIMGRKTWDSIGRPLPGRRNIVVTRNASWHAQGAETAASLQDALRKSLATAQAKGGDVFIIGGAQLYAQALQQQIDAVFLTEIDADFPGDAHFPALDPARWRERSRQHFAPVDGRPFGFDFVCYESVASPNPSFPLGDSDVR